MISVRTRPFARRIGVHEARFCLNGKVYAYDPVIEAAKYGFYAPYWTQ